MFRTTLILVALSTLIALSALADPGQPVTPAPMTEPVAPPSESVPSQPAPMIQAPVPAAVQGVVVEPAPEILAYHLPILRFGAVVAKVEKNAPLSALQSGDVVIAVNGQLLRGFDEFPKAMLASAMLPTRLLVFRAGRPCEVEVNSAAPLTSAPRKILGPIVSTDVRAINLNLPQGALSVTGANGHYRLEASLPDARGQWQQLRREGSLEQIRETVSQFPDPLRSVAQEQLR